LHKLSLQLESPDEKKKEKKKERKNKREREKKERRKKKEEKMVVGLEKESCSAVGLRKKEAAPFDPARPTVLITGLPLRLRFPAFR
jgi:hypothetical protein